MSHCIEGKSSKTLGKHCGMNISIMHNLVLTSLQLCIISRRGDLAERDVTEVCMTKYIMQAERDVTDVCRTIIGQCVPRVFDSYTHIYI